MTALGGLCLTACGGEEAVPGSAGPDAEPGAGVGASAALTVEEPTRLEDPTRVDPAVAEAAGRAWERAAEAPGDAGLRLELAQVYDANGLFDLARRTYDEVIAIDPSDARAHYHRGCMELRLGDWEEALASFQAARERAPDYAPAHWQVANILLDFDRLEEARAAYAEARRLAPGDPTGALGEARVELQRGDVDAALEELRAVLERWPDDGWANGLLARALARAGDAEGAANARALAGEGTYAWVDPWRVAVRTRAAGYGQQIERAKELLGAGRVEEAIELALALFETSPDNVTVQGLLTAAWVQSGEFERAREMLERAVRKQPDHYRIHMNLGIVHARAGRPAQAAQAIERALELNPQYAQGHAFLGDLRADAEEWAGAEAALGQALRLGVDTLKTRLTLGRARASLGDFDGAVQAFREAIQAYPQADTPHAYLALALTDGGRFDEAREAFDRLEQRAPEHGLLATGRARLAALEERAGVRR